MARFKIKKGKNLSLMGEAAQKIIEMEDPSFVALYPLEFKGINPRVLSKVGDSLQKGAPLIEDKNGSGVLIVAPLGGTVSAINRGDKRKLISVVIEGDPKASVVKHSIPDNLDRSACVDLLKKSGLWVIIRQRPFSKILHPDTIPVATFVKAFYSDPLAINFDVILQEQSLYFQKGLDILKHLTSGTVHLCCSSETQSQVLLDAKGVEKHFFSGPHPSGNVSTFIHNIHPIQKETVVSYLDAQDVIRLGEFLSTGIVPQQKIFAVTGTGVPEEKRVYVKSSLGSSLSHLLQKTEITDEHCYISGSVLTGTSIRQTGFVRYYDSQIHVLPDRSDRKLLRFARMGCKEFTISKTWMSSLCWKQDKPVLLDTSINGSDRAIVLNDIYDRYVSLNIYTYFLIKAIVAKQWDEAEALGLLECDPEDFALASFACPSKVDVMEIIAYGLDFFEKEA